MNDTMKNLLGGLRLLLAVALWLAAAPHALAFVLSPCTMDFEPAGRGANRNFQLENPSDQPVAVQVSILTRQMDENGNETYAPADSDFTIYPPQAVLQAGQNQTIRVTWLGRNKPAKELNYRIMAEQLPVNLTKETKPGARVNIMLRYLGTIYVAPKGARCKLVLDSISQEKTTDGKTNLIITLENQGNAHALLRDLKLELKAGGQTIQLPDEALKGMAGENILSRQKRRFVVPCPEGFEGKPVQVKYEFDAPR